MANFQEKNEEFFTFCPNCCEVLLGNELKSEKSIQEVADRETDSCTAEAKAFSTIQQQNPTPNPQNSSAPNWLWCWWQKDRKRNLALASQSCSKETPRVLQVWRPAEAKLESEKKLFTKPVSLLLGRLNLQLPMEGEGGKEEDYPEEKWKVSCSAGTMLLAVKASCPCTGRPVSAVLQDPS